jgi:hypothetical protein
LSEKQKDTLEAYALAVEMILRKCCFSVSPGAHFFRSIASFPKLIDAMLDHCLEKGQTQILKQLLRTRLLSLNLESQDLKHLQRLLLKMKETQPEFQQIVAAASKVNPQFSQILVSAEAKAVSLLLKEYHSPGDSPKVELLEQVVSRTEQLHSTLKCLGPLEDKDSKYWDLLLRVFAEVASSLRHFERAKRVLLCLIEFGSSQ